MNQERPLDHHEESRLKALHGYQVLDTEEEPLFDGIAQIAASICNTPIAFVTLIDRDRVWIKAQFGICRGETSREYSFCNHTIQQSDLLIVKDATQDERFSQNPFVTGDPKIRFYAGVPLITSSGHVIGAVCVVDQIPRDITSDQKTSLRNLSDHVMALLELKVANRQLNKNEAKFKALFEHAPIGMIEVDDQRNCIEANGAYAQMMGYTREELKKLNLFTFTHPDDLQISYEASKHLVSRDASINKLKKRYITKKGEVIWGQVSTRTLLNDDTGKLHLFTVVEDITEQKKMEDDLQEKEVQLLHSSKMSALGEMAAGMAHEINNPLAIIGGYAGLLRMQILKDPTNIDTQNLLEKLSQIGITVERLAKIVRGLKLFSRNADQDPMVRVSVQQVVDETLGFCRERFYNKSIQINTDIPNDFYFFVRPSQITQVLLNLLNNSYDAIEGGTQPWIKIEAQQKNNHLLLSIIDSGPKISVEIQKKMMEPFFTTKDIGKGTGLGLSISKGLVEHNGGILSYDSSHPHNRFILEVPLK